MSKKKETKKTAKEQPNPNHKEDFLSVLSKAVKPKENGKN